MSEIDSREAFVELAQRFSEVAALLPRLDTADLLNTHRLFVGGAIKVAGLLAAPTEGGDDGS
jgi:hypothetical protein